MKVGDVVHLKSGGWLMTISGVLPQIDAVHCRWHDKNGVSQECKYHISILTVLENPERIIKAHLETSQ